MYKTLKARVTVEFELDVKEYHMTGTHIRTSDRGAIWVESLKSPTESVIRQELTDLVNGIHPSASEDKWCPFIPVSATITEYILQPSEEPRV